MQSPKLGYKEKRRLMKALITRKVGMTSTIAENGVVSAVTLLSVAPCKVTQVKTVETDGYDAVQLGCEETKKLNKAQAGHAKKAKFMPKIIREIRLDGDTSELNVGDEISTDIFNVGDRVEVVGTSKGKGFAGTIKRHNFHRQRKTHGGKGNTRKLGSIGSMYPQKVMKGRKMAGRMGAEQVTVKNLKIALIDPELGVIGVTGAVPGPRQSLVVIKGANDA